VRELNDAAQADDMELAPAAQAERAEDLERLSSALDSLDDELREVLVLRRIFDVPPGVVAHELGIAESTVRWRTAQALAHLATRLRVGTPDKEPA
jgi:RNA polymerase sigma factor (sigma-70 family)